LPLRGEPEAAGAELGGQGRRCHALDTIPPCRISVS
jgi:hypothetical protein